MCLPGVSLRLSITQTREVRTMLKPADKSHSAMQQDAQSCLGGSAGLAQKIAKWSMNNNIHNTKISGLTLYQWDAPTEKTSYLLQPSICLIGQGRKRVILGDGIHEYDADHFLITSVELPVVSHVIEASSEKPFMGLTLDLDLRTIAQMILNADIPVMPAPRDRLSISVSRVSESLLDAFLRLLKLLETPEDIPVLAPLIKQEIAYRLLTGEQGPRLRQITTVENHSYQIARAIDWMKNNFQKSIRVEELAGIAGLSTSAFHNHFRLMTAMTPIQYQKRMRLNEARQLMLTAHMDASSAAFEVGYESPSQFSREYSRYFGAPPARDIKTLIDVSS